MRRLEIDCVETPNDAVVSDGHSAGSFRIIDGRNAGLRDSLL